MLLNIYNRKSNVWGGCPGDGHNWISRVHTTHNFCPSASSRALTVRWLDFPEIREKFQGLFSYYFQGTCIWCATMCNVTYYKVGTISWKLVQNHAIKIYAFFYVQSIFWPTFLAGQVFLATFWIIFLTNLLGSVSFIHRLFGVSQFFNDLLGSVKFFVSQVFCPNFLGSVINFDRLFRVSQFLSPTFWGQSSFSDQHFGLDQSFWPTFWGGQYFYRSSGVRLFFFYKLFWVSQFFGQPFEVGQSFLPNLLGSVANFDRFFRLSILITDVFGMFNFFWPAFGVAEFFWPTFDVDQSFLTIFWGQSIFYRPFGVVQYFWPTF